MFEDLKQEIVEHFEHRLSEAFAQMEVQPLTDKDAMIAAIMPTIIATYADNIGLIEQACGFTGEKR